MALAGLQNAPLVSLRSTDQTGVEKQDAWLPLDIKTHEEKAFSALNSMQRWH